VHAARGTLGLSARNEWRMRVHACACV
jgi:hypothetical protein